MPLIATGVRPHDGDAEYAVVDARTGTGTNRTTESVPVVGHEEGRAAAVSVTARPSPAHVEFAATGPERIRHGIKQGPDLGGAVPGALHRLGVQAERHVVDEHPAVDIGEVHHPLAAVDEGVQGTDHI